MSAPSHPPNPLADDLDFILGHTEPLWRELSGSRLFITGGTGFFGSWLLETLVWANEKLGVDVTALVLTRDVARFQRHAAHLAGHKSLRFHAGDVRDFSFPLGDFSHVIHGATTSAEETFRNEDALRKFDTVALGTRRTLEFAQSVGCQKFLLTSSGSVYGKQPENISHVTEDYPGAPGLFDAKTALGEGKRTAEFFCAYYADKFGFDATIARCFSFVGPYLQMDIHYAIGNFIVQAMRREAIVVRGDGTPRRSFMYAADLMIWLWTILLRGKSGRPYNVGSERSISIADLAHQVAALAEHPVPVVISTAPTDVVLDVYVPSTARARLELGLDEYVSSRDAIQRTMRFLGEVKGRS